MRSLLTSITIILFIISCASPKRSDGLYVVSQPAEFEPQDAIWLIWPSNDHKEGESVEKVLLAIIDAISREEKVIVTCRNAALLTHATEVIKSNLGELENVELLELPSNDIWTRDMGPVFVKTNQNTIAVADFNFNSWGYTDTVNIDTKKDEMYDVNVAKQFDLHVFSSSMISEGGNREVNGKGTLLTTESVEAGRNPDMTKKQMEAEYKRLMGVNKIIWLKKGLVEDDHTFLGPIPILSGEKAYTVVTTNGHVDEFARFVNDSTILFAQIDSTAFNDPIAFENHKLDITAYSIPLISVDSIPVITVQSIPLLFS